MVTNRRTAEIVDSDYYPTPEWATKALLKYETFYGPIWEPACGEGDMSKVLIEAGHEVYSSDIVDRGYGKTYDFLSHEPGGDEPFTVKHIITNPPFYLAEQFIETALPIIAEHDGKACFLLRTAFLESAGRYERLFSHNPPNRLYVFTERLSMYPKGGEVKGGGTTSYAWFIWDNAAMHPETHIRWIEPGLKPNGRKISRS